MTAISDKYAQLGGPQSFLGNAVSPELPAAGGGSKQEFQHGTIYFHQRTGAFEVHGAIRARFLALGSEGSAFGYPTSDETVAQDGVGRFNNFENASIFWHPDTDAHEIHGPIRERWRAMGSERATLGYPTTNEQTTTDGIGRYNHFQKGSIYWSPTTGAHEVFGLIRARWAALRWEQGLLGYPITTPFTEVRNRITFFVALFQKGMIEVNSDTQQVYVKRLAGTTPNYSIPVIAYRVSDTDGSRPCAITVDGVQQWINEANRVFSTAGIRFTYDGILRDLRDTEVNNLRGEGDSWWKSARDRLNQLAAQHRSVVVVHRADIGGGFSWWTYDFVAMSFFDSVHLNALSILAHELGHHFGLPHTFGRVFPNAREAEDYILSARPIDELDGDRTVIDDTPPDPYIENLHGDTAIQAIALDQHVFQIARKNIMSYWDHGGTGYLSPSQCDRIRQVVVERKNRYLNVSESWEMWQIDWRWCQKCQGLFFSNGQPGAGRCPAGGQHEKGTSGNYTLAHNQVGFVGQQDWRWCHKCHGLFFSGGQSTAGRCSAGGQHEKGVSGSYTLPHEQANFPGQSDWRWCHKCQGLFYAGGRIAIGRCPAGGQHERNVSGNYTLIHNP